METTAIDAVLTVSLHGHLHDSKAWDAFSAEHGVPVLIDAAGVAGYQKIGPTTSAVFSLHATKPLGIGEGGFLAKRSLWPFSTSPPFWKAPAEAG
jgi:dTDP-4-amino-4,6-dideoxygalactose transaminase